MNLKLEEEQKSSGTFNSVTENAQKNEAQLTEVQNRYDEMLRKLEEEVRSHIHNEQQLKVQLESSIFDKDSYDHLKQECEARERAHQEVSRCH